MDLCFSQRSSYIAFGCDDGSFGIFNTRTKAIDIANSPPAPAYTIKSVSFSKEYDAYVVTGSSDGQIIVRAFIPGDQAQCNAVWRD
jgi:WD40 repeat protein